MSVNGEADAGTYQIEFKLKAEDDRGHKSECVFPAEVGGGADHTDRCGCELLVTPPMVVATSKQVTFSSMLVGPP